MKNHKGCSFRYFLLYKMQRIHFILFLLLPFLLFGQSDALKNEQSEQFTQEEIPPAVVWALSTYFGMANPMAPQAFADFWKPGFYFAFETDILLKNDYVLGFSLAYSSLPFDQNKFLTNHGVKEASELPYDLDIGISQVLFTFKGKESYLVPKYGLQYEFGGGMYIVSNAKVDLPLYGQNSDYQLSHPPEINWGVLFGLEGTYLFSETMLFSIKSRFHHVFLPYVHHQFIDILFGITII